jgi:hypothetical protein
LQPGAGGCKPQRPHIEKFLQVKQFVFIDVFVRSPAYNKLKTPTKAGGKAFHEQHFKTKTARGGRGAGTPALYVRERKNRERKNLLYF